MQDPVVMEKVELAPNNNTLNTSSRHSAVVKNCVDVNNARIVVEDNNVIVVDNVDIMKSTDLTNGMFCATDGYYNINDGGHGMYHIHANNSDVDDGGSIIILDNGNVAELITDGTVNVKQFGAVGDGVTEDTTAIQNAIDFAGNTLEVYFPYGTYYTDTINLDSTVYDFGHSIIKLKPSASISSVGEIKATTTLVSAYSANDTKITVADGSEAEVGDIVCLKSTDVYNPSRPNTYYVGGTFYVENVSGNVLTISPSIPLAMSTTTTVVEIVTPKTTTIKNIKNFLFDDPSISNLAIKVDKNKNSIVSNVTLTTPTKAFLGFRFCWNCVGINLSLRDYYEDDNTTYYYVLQNSASTDTKIINSEIISNWHSYSDTGKYLTINTVIEKCIFRKHKTAGTIGQHNCAYSLTVKDTTFENGTFTGNVLIENCANYGSLINFCGNYTHPECCNLIIRNSKIYNNGNTKYPIRIIHEAKNPSVTYSGVNNVLIENTFLLTLPGGLLVHAVSNPVNVKNIDINNSNISIFVNGATNPQSISVEKIAIRNSNLSSGTIMSLNNNIVKYALVDNVRLK